jgi:FkbM family methyltransferase
MNDMMVRLGHLVAPKLLRGIHGSNLAMALKVRHLFEVLRIETVIDVGANQGQFHKFLRQRVNFKGQIESFEPLPELVEKLQTEARNDDKWRIHPCALGAEPGEMTINVMTQTELSSFRRPISIDDEKFDRVNTITRSLPVAVETLDRVFAGSAGLGRTYLKLDTQGFDLEVVKGGPQTIGYIPALQTEVSIRPLYAEMPDYREAIARFESLGFAIADLFLVSSDEAHRAIEFDCIMIR